MDKYLLDTHILIWLLSSDSKFPFYKDYGLKLLVNEN